MAGTALVCGNASMKALRLTSIVAALSACDVAEEPTPIATALPAQVCNEAQAAVREVTKDSAVVLTSPVEATIAHESWLPMPEGQRDALTRAMGLAATCAGGAPKLQQEVVVRSETGQVLTRRIIETSASPAGL